jgi:putative DNA-invertase from lambdoid prophage Rac
MRDQFDATRDMLNQNAGIGSIAKATGLSRQAIYRIRDDQAGAESALSSWGM